MLNPNFKKVCEHIDKLDFHESMMARILCQVAIDDTLTKVTHERLKVATPTEESQIVEFMALLWYVDEYKNF